MCTVIVEKVKVTVAARREEWLTLEQANIAYDHSSNAPMEHALNIDIVNESEELSSHVVFELTRQAALHLAEMMLAVLDQAEADKYLARSA